MNHYVLGNRTDITQPFTLSFTSYIDSITNHTTGTENRRPPLSQFHVNQYQLNTGYEGFYLNGGPSSGDVDLNRSFLLDGTGQTVVHTTIDDHPSVLSLLLTRFRQRVAR